MTYPKNRKTTRLQHWDYAQNGYYFITICTKDKEEYFGKIIDGEMILSEVGKLAQYYWYEISKHFDFIELDVFVVMPNHIHGILIINKPVGTTASPCPSVPNLENKTNKINRFQNQGKGTISSIIGSYKSIVTKEARKISAFAWQSRFYDNIIRDDKGYEQIVEYVENNPLKWEDDMFYV